GIPSLPPLFAPPWELPGPDGRPLGLSLELLRALAPSAFAIAMLGAIESLLSAVIADGMIRRKHDPNAELLAQGVGNLVAPFFGGFAATGAIARTATNIRAGGRSPIAAVWHSVVVLAAMLVLAPWLRYLPMASLAALLLVVAWNLGEFRHVARALRTSPGADALVLLACFGLTVVFDMVVAVTAGVLLASLLFMRRMSEVTGVTLVAEPHRVLPRPVPPEVVVYEVAGPLFFGAAQKAMSVLHNVAPGVRVVLVDLRSVPAIDSTGLVNLESAIGRLRTVGVFTILGGVRQQPLLALRRAGWPEHSDWISIHESFDEALALAANGRP
ncbi:MAG TPA: SulP family inorganic anion transporter, partial [Planctomycetota bacterium]|nr:SulP family inorganic anion transporter [Planctomycetota bacterium]